ncbi:MAG: alpha/beta hydrolase [Verrucomicrobia bacterium]|nr:alpha/beta hydrolase [Verrucomicrobiota bacterium]
MKTYSLIIALATLLASSAAADPRIEKDLRYADRSERNVLDIYLPEGVKNPPLVVWIHGGAFRMGDKRNPEGLGALLDAGFAVASINYRLSNEAIWPAPLEDLRDAFTFLRAHAAKYGYDASRIASFGSSAGGHLSAMAGIALADDPKTRLAASVVWFPPIDFPTMDEDIERTGIQRRTGRNDASDSPESALIGATVKANPDLARAASPVTYLEKLPAGTKLPAFLIMHGAKDPFIARGQSGRLFSALLARQDIRTLEYVLLPEGGHGSGDFQKPETIARVVSFLKANFTTGHEGGGEPDGAANGSQPIRSETNRTSSAAGSRR